MAPKASVLIVVVVLLGIFTLICESSTTYTNYRYSKEEIFESLTETEKRLLFGGVERPNFGIVFPSWRELKYRNDTKILSSNKKQLTIKHDNSVINVSLEPSTKFLKDEKLGRSFDKTCHWRFVNPQYVVTVDECLQKGIHSMIISETHHRIVYPANLPESKFVNKEHHPHIYYEVERSKLLPKNKDLNHVKAENSTRRLKRATVNDFADFPDNEVDLESDLERFRVHSLRKFVLNQTVFDEAESPLEIKVQKTVEIAIFCDSKLAENFGVQLTETSSQISLPQYVEILVNALEGIYHQEELRGYVINFKIVQLRILEPGEGPNAHSGNIRNYLRDFSTWQNNENSNSDSDPGHWDNAIMLSGYNLHSNGLTGVAGLAWVGGMCLGEFSSSMNEGGTFQALYIVAHEIGHNFGMDHDGYGSASFCDQNSHIMSPSIGPGKTTWSTCSSQLIQQFLGESNCLDDNQGKESKMKQKSPSDIDAIKINLPGQIYSAEKQCHLAFGSKYSVASTSSDMCHYLFCSDGRNVRGAHPALQGSTCEEGMICIAGSCKPEQELRRLVVLFMNVFEKVGEEELEKIRVQSTNELHDESEKLRNLPFTAEQKTGVDGSLFAHTGLIQSNYEENQPLIGNRSYELRTIPGACSVTCGIGQRISSFECMETISGSYRPLEECGVSESTYSSVEYCYNPECK